MITPEVFSKMMHSPRYEARRSRQPSHEDLLLASQGISQGIFGFLMCVYAGDKTARHDFFAGLFADVMQDDAIQSIVPPRWRQSGYRRQIETLVLLAVTEWIDGNYTQQKRAQFLGVSRGTWNRKYNSIYQLVVAVPVKWEAEVTQKINERLR